MITVINTIQIKSGFGNVLRERFKSPKSVHTFPGFIRLELLQTLQLDTHEEYQVCTTWQDKESFDAWVQSDSFRHAHAQRKESDSNGFVIGNKITLHEVIHSHLPAAPEQADAR